MSNCVPRHSDRRKIAPIVGHYTALVEEFKIATSVIRDDASRRFIVPSAHLIADDEIIEVHQSRNVAAPHMRRVV